MNQDALITVETPIFQKNPLSEIAERHIEHLRSLGTLKPEHELSAALVIRLAMLAGHATKGYAAAQLFRELREAIADLPVPEADEDTDDLAAELEALVYGS